MVKTDERIKRANDGIYEMPMAMITLSKPGPKAATIAKAKRKQASYNNGDQNGRKANPKRKAGAVHDARVSVPAKLIRAKNMLSAWALEAVADVLLNRVIRGYIGGEDREEYDDKKDDAAYDRPAVFQQLAHDALGFALANSGFFHDNPSFLVVACPQPGI
jgi:hypothetical protein